MSIPPVAARAPRGATTTPLRRALSLAWSIVLAILCVLMAMSAGGVFGVTKGLVEEFGPERVRDTPISEQVIAAAAVGAAATGTRPVAEIMYVDFMALTMEPLVNQAAKMRYMFGGKITLPLVMRAQEGAGRGNAGSAITAASQSLSALPPPASQPSRAPCNSEAVVASPSARMAASMSPRNGISLVMEAVPGNRPEV